MKKRKQQSQERKQKNWYQSDFTSRFMFLKKQSERMLVKKVWDHTIETKEGFVLRKGKIYPLLRRK